MSWVDNANQRTEIGFDGEIQGKFSYGSSDAVANVAKQTGQLLRCHTLVWYSQLPSWVSSAYGKDQMQSIITTRISNVADITRGNAMLGIWLMRRLRMMGNGDRVLVSFSTAAGRS